MLLLSFFTACTSGMPKETDIEDIGIACRDTAPSDDSGDTDADTDVDTGETAEGTQMSEYFPYDGNRTAEYFNEDTAGVPWKLVVEKLEPTETIGDYEVVTFE